MPRLDHIPMYFKTLQSETGTTIKITVVHTICSAQSTDTDSTELFAMGKLFSV